MSTTAQRLRSYTGPALFSFGFRPFFLLAALWAALSVPLWIVVYSLGPGAVPVDAGLVWHVHEMVFGYGSAVVAGFLLTAIPNWTGRLPVCDAPLLFLVALWFVGRLAYLFEPGPEWAPGLADSAFLILFAGIVWREVIAGRNTRNIKVAAAVTAFALANVCFHVMSLTSGGLPRPAMHAGLAVLVFLILLIGGRITPSFTRNWLASRGGRAPTPFNRFDSAVLLLSLAALVGWVFGEGAMLVSAGLVIVGVLNFVRLARWRAQATLAEPLVTILHIGFAWAALALLLLGLSGLFPAFVPRVAGVHAAGAGAIGVMTLAVMTRSSLGHTGRALTAGAGTRLIYLLVNLAALARVSAPFTDFPVQSHVNHIAAALWAGAFLAFVVVYGPRLASPRLAAKA